VPGERAESDVRLEILSCNLLPVKVRSSIEDNEWRSKGRSDISASYRDADAGDMGGGIATALGTRARELASE
jgi:hypothetical protein